MSRARHPAPPAPSAREVRRLRAALLRGYDEARRALPWRGETDPYRVWVSEVMLQQTRVDTVIPYYRRWLELFPDVAALARAELDDVLLAWQGLGYYGRARSLHAGAAVVRERHGGEVPASFEALRALPGVGDYTAGAVASIAYGAVVPAVDGNARRVLARLLDDPAPRPARLRDVAGALVDPGRPGDFNQALMELGATVCTPRRPDCAACPLAPFCRARAAGTQEERPAARPRAAAPAAAFVVAVVVDPEGRALVARRPDRGLLARLWAFPDAPLDGAGEGRGVAASALRGLGVRVGPGAWPVELPPVRHRFTHLDATYWPVLLAGEGGEAENRRWIPLEGPWPVALPVAQQKIAGAAAAALAGIRRRRASAPCASRT